jgi:polyisoprenoid-binding protein YceI
MQQFRACIHSVGLLVLAAALGCADPAANKPKAVVSEATQEEAPAPTAARFVVTDESKINFVGSKVTGSHDGGFKEFDGEIHVLPDRPEASSVKVVIDTTSLWSDNDRLTGHLKSADFFEVDKYPTATFTSTDIRRDGDRYTVTGNLDMHGVTKSISFPAQIQAAPDRVTANAEFAIKRFDFNIVYPGKAEDLIRDEVVVKLDLVAVPAGSDTGLEETDTEATL